MIVELSAALMILGLAQTMSAEQQAAHHVMRGPPPPKVTGSDSCVSLSMGGGLPIIPVQIGGKTYNFVFDTGAPGGPTLRPEVVRELGLTQIGEARMSDPSMKNVVSVPLYRLPEIRVGGLSVADWVASERATREGRFGDPDGVFGPQAFAGYVVTYDYPRSRLLIRKDKLPDADNRTSFSYSGAIPEVTLTIDGRTIKAHVDTGNGRYGLIVPKEFAAQLSGFGKSYPIGIARTANNRYDLSAFPVDSANVGAMPLYPGTAAYPGPAQHANIGSLLLRDMVVKVDPARKIIAFERASGTLESGCPSA